MESGRAQHDAARRPDAACCRASWSLPPTHALQSGRITFRSRHQLERVFHAIKQRAARGASDGSLDTTLTGIARGVIVLRAKLVVSASQMLAGASMAKDMAAARQAAARNAGFTPQNDFESCALLSEESLESQREPYATPRATWRWACRSTSSCACS